MDIHSATVPGHCNRLKLGAALLVERRLRASAENHTAGPDQTEEPSSLLRCNLYYAPLSTCKKYW